MSQLLPADGAPGCVGREGEDQVSDSPYPEDSIQREERSAPVDPVPPTEPARPAVPLQVLKGFGSVVAPLSLLTALMYYFGVLHAYWFFRSLGVDYTVFELSTQDYLARSADGLFVPLTGAAVVLLLGVWGHRLLPERVLVDREGRWVRLLVTACAVLGAGATAVALVGLAEPEALVRWLTLPGLALATGVLLLLAASRLARAHRLARHGVRRPVPGPVAVTEWAAALVLVSVGLFWAAGDWSAAVGTGRAQQLADSLDGLPDAVLYAERSLNLGAPGVRETRCAQPDAAHAVRYDGLKLVVHAGGQYLFLPERWRPEDGTAVVLPEADARRLEFTAPGVARTGTC